MWNGGLTPGAEHKNSLQGEKDYNPRLRFVRVCSCSSLCFCDSEGIHVLADSCRLSRSPQRCKRIASLDTNRSIALSVYSRPACRLGSFVRMVPTVALENPVSFGSRETGSLEGTSTTKRPLRGHSLRTGGSRLGISSPSTRRGIYSEIPCGRLTCLTFVDLTRLDI